MEFSGALECWIEESSLTYQCFTVCKLKVIKSVSHHHDADVPPSRSDLLCKRKHLNNIAEQNVLSPQYKKDRTSKTDTKILTKRLIIITFLK